MNRSIALLASLFAFCAVPQSMDAQTTPLTSSKEGGGLEGHFEIFPASNGLSLGGEAGEPVMHFAPVGSETVVLIHGSTPDVQQVDLESVSVDFLINKVGSIGLFLRGDESLASRGAYLVLVNIKEGRKGQMRLFKHSIRPLQHPDENLLASQDLQHVRFQKWYRLVFSTRQGDAGTVVMTAKLIDIEDGSTLADMEMEDFDAPLNAEGQVALRLYSLKKASGHLEIKNLVLTPR